MHNIITTRRSIRRYTAQPVPQELVQELLRAGMSAPSACNSRPWHFVVLTAREQLNAIADVHPYAAMLRTAPLGIAVCGDPTALAVDEYWVQDCSAAAENILLAAHALGLGGVWLGVHPRPERAEPIKELLELPDPIQPLCVLSLGYPAEQKETPDRYDPARVHHNRW